MGIRPKMCLIFGIDDYAGGEVDWIKWEEISLKVPQKEIVDQPFTKAYFKDNFYDYKTKKWGSVADYIFIGHHVEGVIGLKIDCAYDCQIVRTLSVFHEEYQEWGKLDLPVLDPDDPKNLYYVRDIEQNQDLYKCGDIPWQWSWFYPSIIEVLYTWPVWAYCTRYLLELAGIESNYKNYKAMFVWEWV